MTNYAKRTCVGCGIRLPQPQMFQKEHFVRVANSRSGISIFTFLGALFGRKDSMRSIGKWFWNSNQRDYNRKKTSWVCGECGGYKNTKIKKPSLIGRFFKTLFKLIFISGIVIAGLFLLLAFTSQ